MSMRPRTISFGHDFAANMAAVQPPEDDGPPLCKRSRLSPSHYDLLAEPKPLGLRLKKSPSFLELIEMRLAAANASAVAAVPAEIATNGNKKEATPSASDRLSLKALNFNASSLRVGSWEFIAKHEGDLVAKCYFAKKKLVWEVLDGGLKCKIDILWSDIVGLKANCPDNSPGTLTIVLARRPIFSKETNPQPRKHTLWQASSDFTKGEASIYRTHVLQCPTGVLNKHYEKLLQSDERLNLLSQQVELFMESPYFDVQTSLTRNPDERSCFEIFNGGGSPISSFHDGATPSLSKDASSPSSGMDANIVEGNSYGNPSAAQTLKIGGLHHSVSMTDLMSEIGQHISEGVFSGRIPSNKAAECKEVLENVAEILLSDTPNIAESDERLMKKVNSLCCLLQEESAPAPPPENPSGIDVGIDVGSGGVKWEINPDHDHSGSFQPPPGGGMQRKDSFGDFLLNLPRIASYPKFLWDIDEDGGNKFR